MTTFAARGTSEVDPAGPRGWPTAQGEVRWLQCRNCGGTVYRARFEDDGRVCSGCGHHHTLPIRARLDALVDEGGLTPLPLPLPPRDPLNFNDSRPYLERQQQARARSGHDEAMVAGTATIAGVPVVVTALDFGFMGGSMGTGVGALFAAAVEEALETGSPLIMVAASGGARMQEGCLSLMQLATTAQGIGRLREAGVPTVNVNVNPTYGGVTASFAMLGDVILAEPGARIGFAGPDVIRATIRQELPSGFQSAEFLLEHGMIDMVVPRDQLRDRLARVLRCLVSGSDHLMADSARLSPSEPDRNDLLDSAQRPAVEIVHLARNLQRPTVDDYVAHLFDDVIDLSGDRCFADDPAMRGGLARIGDSPVVFIGHRKAHDTGGMVARNFGMPRPEGYRKACRLMRLAERLGLPVVAFIDTPGAYPGLEAEERGQATAIAECILTSARLRVPIVSVVTGEGGSGGALALGTADRVLMAENAYYSVISPEGCSTILFGGPEHASTTAELLHLRAIDLLRLGVIERIVAEPEGGAHRDADLMCARVAGAVREALHGLVGVPADGLVASRQQRFDRFTQLVTTEG